jgi:hypothetical protein
MSDRTLSSDGVTMAARDDQACGGKYHVIGSDGFTFCGRLGAQSVMQARYVPNSDRCQRAGCKACWPDYRDPSDRSLWQ